MKTNLTHVLLSLWNSGIKNFLIAVALGALGGATLSAIDRTAYVERHDPSRIAEAMTKGQRIVMLPAQ